MMDIVTLAAARKYTDAKAVGLVPKGDYNADTEYQYGDWVSADGGSYGYIYPAPSTGVPVTDTMHWQQIAQQGSTVTSAAIVGDDIVLTKDDATTVTLAGAKTALTGPAGGLTEIGAASMANIVSHGSGLNPNVTVSGNTITVEFLSSIYCTKRFGSGDYLSLNKAGTTYTLNHNDALIWHLDTNTIAVEPIGSSNKNNAIILLFNSGGTMPYGALIHGILSKSLENLHEWCAVTPKISTGKYPNFDTTNKTLTIYSNSDILYNNGNNYHSFSADVVIPLEVSGTSVTKVYFDPTNKTFTAIAMHTKIPNGCLLVCFGRSTNGAGLTALFPFTIDGYEYRKPSTLSVKEPSTRHYIVNSFAADQGMAVVRDKILVFRAGADDHSTYGNIELFDKDTFTYLGAATHNTGHAANASYCPKTDTLMVSNANLSNAPPEIQLISGASSITVSDTIEYSSIMPIKLYEGTAGALTKDLGRTAIQWVFGDSPHIVYGHALSYSNGNMDSSKSIYYKVLLGMGANDYSDPTGTDLMRWGTFASGKTNSEYNGTAKIIAQYTGDYAGISQGACWHDGKFYFASTTGSDAAEVMAMKFDMNGKASIVERFIAPDINLNGTVPNQEAEGCAILDGRYLIAGYRGGAGQKLAVFPLYNEQGGIGAVGVPITFMFPCNSVPHIQVTPNSETTDIYISAVSETGFTVSSASDGAGTFNWSCRIS